jgi:DNA-binding CsgD family transcriptional regulator
MTTTQSVRLDAKMLRSRKKAQKCIAQLSPAEKAVYDRILQGKSAIEIAKELRRSPFTVSNHTRKIFEAFGTQSRSKLLAMLVVPLSATE